MNVNEIKPTNEELRVILETGFVLRESSKFDDAEKIFLGCLELMPESEVPNVGLGTVYLQKGNYDLAEESCLKALEINSESDYARVHYGEVLLFQNRRDEATAELEKVINESPNSSYSQTAKSLLAAAEIFDK